MTDEDPRPGEDPVAAQYEAYPYPARDPADEARRFIVGSPSHPFEIDHFLFGGQRDWSAPFRALVAGGGTGDAAIMLAQLLERRGTPAEILYLDRSAASRRIAEARAEARGLKSLTFLTGDLHSAADHGAFDYIDCCGVLHHLPDPEAGFQALSAALTPDGGLGAMVYAPIGRAGVYELQAAFAALAAGAPLADQVSLARRVLKSLPKTHPFVRNPLVRDHIDGGDAGLVDLLLHGRDTPFSVGRLSTALAGAGLALQGFAEPARYEPETYLEDPDAIERARALDAGARAALAEQLSGAMKTHVFYAAPAARGMVAAATLRPELTPALHRLKGDALAATIDKRRGISFDVDGVSVFRKLPRQAAAVARLIDGRRTFGEIQAALRLDWMVFSQHAKPLCEALAGFNHLRFTRFLR